MDIHCIINNTSAWIEKELNAERFSLFHQQLKILYDYLYKNTESFMFTLTPVQDQIFELLVTDNW